MRRSDLADLAAFVAVAKQLSFRTAAARLGVTPSALSHTIRHLEGRLGVRLFYRTTRSVSLTDAGFRMLERLKPAFEQIDIALDDLNEEREQPMGHLKIYVSHTAQTAIVPAWENFLLAYPNIQLEFRVDTAPADIVAIGFDAGIGTLERIGPDMIPIKLREMKKIAIVASPAYLAQRGTPRMPAELARHNCIQHRRTADSSPVLWPLWQNGAINDLSVHGSLIVNSPDWVVRAAVGGLGIAYTFEGIIEFFLRSGQLVRILEEWYPPFEELFLYYPSRQPVTTALRAFIKMLQAPAGGNAAEKPI